MSFDSTAGVAHALALIRSRFERTSNPDDVMDFHNVEHTRGVVHRTDALLHAMGATPTERDLGKIAAAFHDTVQRWQENPQPEGRILRKRFAGQNETDSAAEAVAWMKGNGAYDARAAELVTAAILGTIPAWDQQNSTVSQPSVPADAHPVVHAVALADLGIPGMDGGADFVATGDGLFREENLDIARTLRRCTSRADLPAEVVESYKVRVVGWARGQVLYAGGRRARLPIELGNLNGAARAAVEALFCRFDESIAAAEHAAKQREPMAAWDVLRAAGYTIPS